MPRKKPKKKLQDCTFTIPFRAESQERIDNITIVINYLLHHFSTNIIIYETGKKSILKYFWQDEWSKNCRLFHHKETKNIFHKTRLLNKALIMADTPIIISQDADVILPVRQYIEAYIMLKCYDFSFCFPFDNRLIQIDESNKAKLKENEYKLSALYLNSTSKKYIKKSTVSPGGCFFMKRQKFIDAGMENEGFINYGFEDAERKARIMKLGYKIGYIGGYLYHLQHGRTIVSSWYNKYHKQSRQIFTKIRQFSKKQMQEYVKDVLKEQ